MRFKGVTKVFYGDWCWDACIERWILRLRYWDYRFIPRPVIDRDDGEVICDPNEKVVAYCYRTKMTEIWRGGVMKCPLPHFLFCFDFGMWPIHHRAWTGGSRSMPPVEKATNAVIIVVAMALGKRKSHRAMALAPRRSWLHHNSPERDPNMTKRDFFPIVLCDPIRSIQASARGSVVRRKTNCDPRDPLPIRTRSSQ